MPVIGNPRNFFDKFKFVVEIDGVASAGFQKAGELSVEVAEIDYYEGGALIPDKSPGRLKFSDLDLERGATNDVDLYLWLTQVATAGANSGLTAGQFKRNLDVVQQDRDGGELCRWRVHAAWPKKFKAGDWDNGADEKTIESVTLAYDFFERVAGGTT